MFNDIFGGLRDLFDDTRPKFQRGMRYIANAFDTQPDYNDGGKCCHIQIGNSQYKYLLFINSDNEVIIGISSLFIFKRVPEAIIEAANELNREHPKFNCYIDPSSAKPRVQLLFRVSRLSMLTERVIVDLMIEMARLMLQIDKGIEENF